MMGDMNDGKHCPQCGKDIGVWPVLTATLPNRIRCPHCKARLFYKDIGMIVINLLLLLVALCAVAYFFQRQRSAEKGIRFYVHVAALAFAAWLPFELAATFYVRHRGQLQTRDKLNGGDPQTGA